MPKIMGIPDTSKLSDPTKLKRGLVDLITQLHEAKRAGKHYDVRIAGPGGLYSFATRKGFPEPGKKYRWFPQPLHSTEYGEFEGEIPEGYGAGKVKLVDKGKVFITNTRPGLVQFTVAHHKRPERYNMVQMKDGSWLVHNVTPVKPLSEHKKIHFKRIPAEDVEKIFTPENVVQAKIDGSATLYHLLNDKLELTSYRTHKKDNSPIIHTERGLGADAGKPLNLPKHLQGSILRGEIFGTTPDNKAIPPMELGGILNATLANSLKMQEDKGVKLRNLIFNIYRYGKKEIPLDTPYEKRVEMIKEILQYLPDKERFILASGYDKPEDQRKLWEDITQGKHDWTREGVVAWPKAGGKPTKVKTYPEGKVYIREMVPGLGKYTGKGVGAFKYSLEPDSPVVGEVGTGFSDELRSDMFKHPENYIGRLARIRAQEQFPSGAFRAPVFIALHEDYPQEDVKPKQEAGIRKMAGRESYETQATELPGFLSRYFNSYDITKLTRLVEEHKLKSQKRPLADLEAEKLDRDLLSLGRDDLMGLEKFYSPTEKTRLQDRTQTMNKTGFFGRANAGLTPDDAIKAMIQLEKLKILRAKRKKIEQEIARNEREQDSIFELDKLAGLRTSLGGKSNPLAVEEKNVQDAAASIGLPAPDMLGNIPQQPQPAAVPQQPAGPDPTRILKIIAEAEKTKMQRVKRQMLEIELEKKRHAAQLDMQKLERQHAMEGRVDAMGSTPQQQLLRQVQAMNASSQEKLGAVKRWTQNVKTVSTNPPPGLYKQRATEIADVMARPGGLTSAQEPAVKNAFDSNTLLKLSAEAKQIISADKGGTGLRPKPVGNKNPRMGYGLLKGNLAKHPRWKGLGRSAQSQVTPWSVGVKVAR